MKLINKLVTAAALALAGAGCSNNREPTDGVEGLRDQAYAKIQESFSYMFATKAVPTLTEAERHEQASKVDGAGQALWKNRWEKLKIEISEKNVKMDILTNSIVQLRAIIGMMNSSDADQMKMVRDFDQKEVFDVVVYVLHKCEVLHQQDGQHEGARADSFRAQVAGLQRELQGFVQIPAFHDGFQESVTEDHIAQK